MIRTAPEILAAIQADAVMMSVLQQARQSKLPDWWIGAGFVRNKIWDLLHGRNQTPISDVDLIYFDADNTSRERDAELEAQLTLAMSHVAWSVKNQARMHARNNHQPYASSVDALAHWTETATCIAVTLNSLNQLVLASPHGISDLVGLIARPTPNVYGANEMFIKRVNEKKWRARWPKLSIVFD